MSATPVKRPVGSDSVPVKVPAGRTKLPPALATDTGTEASRCGKTSSLAGFGQPRNGSQAVSMNGKKKESELSVSVRRAARAGGPNPSRTPTASATIERFRRTRDLL